MNNKEKVTVVYQEYSESTRVLGDAVTTAKLISKIFS